MAKLKLLLDIECNVFCDGKHYCKTNANELIVIELEAGEYFFEFKTDDNTKLYSKILEIPNNWEKYVNLSLNDKLQLYEREKKHKFISSKNVGIKINYLNNDVRCKLIDEDGVEIEIPYVFCLTEEYYHSNPLKSLNTSTIDAAGLIPVNIGGKLGFEWYEGYSLSGGLYGSINKDGVVQIPLIFDEPVIFTNSYKAIAVINGEKVFINKWGEILPNSYDDILKFHQTICLVKNNNKLGIVDCNDKVVLDIIYDNITIVR